MANKEPLSSRDYYPKCPECGSIELIHGCGISTCKDCGNKEYWLWRTVFNQIDGVFELIPAHPKDIQKPTLKNTLDGWLS